MSNEDEIKIVPSKAVQQARQAESSRPNYVRWIVTLVAVYFALVAMIAFVPLPGYIKTLSLILGTLFLSDVHHSIKYHVKHRD